MTPLAADLSGPAHRVVAECLWLWILVPGSSILDQVV